MPNPRYAKGRSHEYYIKSKYEGFGYFCIRSAGSKGPVDLIAIKRTPKGTIMIPIQCKSGSARMTRAELEKINEFEGITGLKVKVE